MNDQQPECVDPTAYLMRAEDCVHLKDLFVYLVCNVVSQHIPCLRYMSGCWVPLLKRTAKLTHKSVVLPLPLLYKNEQKYEDVVGILD